MSLANKLISKMGSFFNLFRYRELTEELVKREVKSRYKQSILGYAWVILVPLLNLAVLSLVFSVFVRIPTGNIPYPIFLFAGLVPWTFTANAISSATSSLVKNSSLITKVYLPQEVFPIAAILSKFIDLVLTLVILVLFMLVFGISYKLTLLYFPLVFVFQFLLVAGISFILSALNVFYRDVENVISVVLILWMYITPVIYPQEFIPEKFIPIFNLNPMMPIINSYRNIVLFGVPPAWTSFIYACIFSVVIFVVGFLFFKSKSKHFADVV